jgi:hypothetical protein
MQGIRATAYLVVGSWGRLSAEISGGRASQDRRMSLIAGTIRTPNEYQG